MALTMDDLTEQSPKKNIITSIGERIFGVPLSTQQKLQATELSQILALTEDVWSELFPKVYNKEYEAPRLIICHNDKEPYYSGSSKDIFISLTGLNKLGKRKSESLTGSSKAIILAHEVGHHIQNLLGILKGIDRSDKQSVVKTELQADFLAGLWAHHAEKKYNILDKNNINNNLNFIEKCGDDYQEIESHQYTHGTGKQRARRFMKGFETGDPLQGNTFNIPYEDL